MAKLNISGLITKNSVNKFTLKPTAEEFTLFILAFGVLKYTACAVSVASGFAFFYYKLKDLITGFNNADITAGILAIILLICVELITNTSVAKGFKMLFKQRFAAAVACIVIASIFFTASFKISCEGIYLALSDTHKETENITAKYTDDAAELRKTNAAKIQAYESDIAALVGPAWNNNALTTEQLRMRQAYRNAIDSIYKAERRELAAIQEAQAAELSAANAAASSSAADYRGYVAIILLLEILANGVLQFYNKKILHDTDTAIEKKEFIDDYITQSRAELADAIEDNLSKEKALYMSILQEKSDQARNVETQGLASSTTAAQRKAATAKKPAGFNITTDDPNNPTDPAITPDIPSAPSTPTNQQIKTATCKYCGATFQRRTTWQKYCCEQHRIQAAANAKGHAIRGVAPETFANT
ncbi:MAG: hypothetical protein J6T60_04475 [Bacteroidales bacterium]|nr:hypothetical protein [Bacteroidales bacterium]